MEKLLALILVGPRFLDYFGDKKATHFELGGQNHPVQITYIKEPILEVFSAALNLAKCIHEKEEGGDILIFLNGLLYVPPPPPLQSLRCTVIARNSTSSKKRIGRGSPMELIACLPILQTTILPLQPKKDPKNTPE